MWEGRRVKIAYGKKHRTLQKAPSGTPVEYLKQNYRAEKKNE